MPLPRPSNRDIIMPVACRGIIAGGYEMLSICFSVLSLELSSESGELNVGGRSAAKKQFFLQNIEQLFAKLEAIHDGKLKMHDALNGDPMDATLLAKLGSHIDEVEMELLRPLKTFYLDSQTDVSRVHELGGKLARILECASPNAELANQRFADKLEIVTPPKQDEHSVICIDMHEYSKAARVAEAMDDAKSVYNLNLGIKNRVRTAIDNAIERVTDRGSESFPINDRGDGVVVYVPKLPETAVRIAMNFQLDSVKRQHSVASLQTQPGRFRIGVAPGGVCLSMTHSPAYKLIEFSAGGTTIINAARFEQSCPVNAVLIDEKTYDRLSDELKNDFQEFSGVKLKDHEGQGGDGSIKAWIWTAV
ncbi:MAG: hypothetical protein NTY98_06370 [Verrucomicrobia bacterium]|nr:hypothetical protein [Verrucomicrobiota bacterium]